MERTMFTFVPQGSQQLLNVGMSNKLKCANTCLGKKVSYAPRTP